MTETPETAPTATEPGAADEPQKTDVTAEATVTDETGAEGEETPSTPPLPVPVVPTLGPKEYLWGTGRRKTSVARVRMRPGNGTIVVNGRPFDVYFPVDKHRNDVTEPLLATNTRELYDVFANVDGGGITGQAGAFRLGVARALVKAQPELEPVLRSGGFLTRDPRMVERKKYGQRKARRRFQFSKR